MKKEPVRQSNHMPRGKILRRIGLGVLAMLFISAIPVAAWLSHQRRVTAVAKIENPVSIYIGAGQKENMRYIDINNIDVMSESIKTDESGAHYQDFVFSVYGDLYQSYKLQLAFTTNNPFTYTLFPARLSNSPSDAGRVEYLPHTENATPIYYAIEYSIQEDCELVSPIIGRYLNKTEAAQPLAEQANDNTYYVETYESYKYANTHARPVYWQSNSITSNLDASNKFENYYILRVSWPADFTTNTKETDILCIAALGHQQ